MSYYEQFGFSKTQGDTTQTTLKATTGMQNSLSATIPSGQEKQRYSGARLDVSKGSAMFTEDQRATQQQLKQQMLLLQNKLNTKVNLLKQVSNVDAANGPLNLSDQRPARIQDRILDYKMRNSERLNRESYLRNRVNQLSDQIGYYNTFNAENGNATSKYSNQQTDINSMRVDIERMNQQFLLLQKELEEKEVNLQQQILIVDNLQKIIQQQQQKEYEQQQEYLNLNDKVQQLQEQLGAAKLAKAQCELQYASLNDELIKMKKANIDLKAKNTSMTEELKTRDSQIASLSAQLQHVEEKARQRKEELKQYQQLNIELQGKLGHVLIQETGQQTSQQSKYNDKSLNKADIDHPSKPTSPESRQMSRNTSMCGSMKTLPQFAELQDGSKVINEDKPEIDLQVENLKTQRRQERKAAIEQNLIDLEEHKQKLQQTGEAMQQYIAKQQAEKEKLKQMQNADNERIDNQTPEALRAKSNGSTKDTINSNQQKQLQIDQQNQQPVQQQQQQDEIQELQQSEIYSGVSNEEIEEEEEFEDDLPDNVGREARDPIHAGLSDVTVRELGLDGAKKFDLSIQVDEVARCAEEVQEKYGFAQNDRRQQIMNDLTGRAQQVFCINEQQKQEAQTLSTDKQQENAKENTPKQPQLNDEIAKLVYKIEHGEEIDEVTPEQAAKLRELGYDIMIEQSELNDVFPNNSLEQILAKINAGESLDEPLTEEQLRKLREMGYSIDVEE